MSYLLPLPKEESENYEKADTQRRPRSFNFRASKTIL